MNLEHLQEQNRRLRREVLNLAAELRLIREQLNGSWSTGVIVYVFAGLTSGLVGAFFGNLIFWGLR